MAALAAAHDALQQGGAFAGIKVTRDLIRAGQLLNMELLDHVIVGHGNFSSLRALGYIP